MTIDADQVRMLLAALFGAVLAAWLTARTLRWRVRTRGRRAQARGARLEVEAADALRAAGFQVLARHPEAGYLLEVDGEVLEVELQVDYLARRDGRTFAVEVKTGGSARPRQAGTRRQLLEYALFYPVDGVLLFDGDRGHIQTVRFPLGGATVRPIRPVGAILAAFASGAVAGAILWSLVGG